MADHAALIRQIAAGDRTAFQTLYRDLENPVYRFVLSRLQDPFEAHDILHNVFLDVWNNAAALPDDSQVKPWVIGLAHGRMIRRLEQQGWPDAAAEQPESATEDRGFDDDDQEDDSPAGDGAHLRVCLAGLSGEHSTALALAFTHDLSCADIAKVVQIPESTVRARLNEATTQLLYCLTGRLKEAVR